MKILSNISVRNKLTLIIALFLALIFSLESLNLNSVREQLKQSRVNQSKEIVNTAKSIALYYYNLEKVGTMDIAQAKKAALDAMTAMRYEQGNYIFVIDTNVHMVSHPIKPDLNGKDLSNIKDPDGIRLFSAFAEVAKNNGSGAVHYRWPKPGASQPVEKISFVNLMSEWNWIIGTGSYIDDIEEIYFQQLIYALIVLALTIPIILIIVLYISRGITSPLAEITRVMELIATGDFTQKADHDSKDEIGKLAICVNQTVLALSQLIKSVEQSCNLIKQSTESAAATTAQTVAGVKKQKDETAALAAAMHEMSMTAQEVAITAGKTADSSHDADAAAQKGNQIVDATISRINNVALEMESLLSTISQLEQDTEEVENILNVISNISDQTNLLALNAAIEAARAGDQGRGFAVVADEVRQLAKRTQESTSQIRELNERLKSAFGNAVVTVRKGHEHTKHSSESAENAGTYIHAIVKQINEILDMSNMVANAVKQQSIVTEDMNQNITTISNIAEETSEGASETAGNSQSLADMAQQLENSLRQFRIG